MSKPQFYKLKIGKVKKETADSVIISLDVPNELKEQYQFQAGQYLNFKKIFQGEEVRRSYSICCSPHENKLCVAIKQVKGGVFSTYANQEMKAGDEVEVMTPLGTFTTQIDSQNSKKYLAFAAGSGITPIMSLLKTILLKEPKSTFTLIYGNKNAQSIMFREELEAVKNKYQSRFQLIHVLSREQMESDLNNGRINDEKCAQLFDRALDVKSFNQFFLCGPEEMIWSVKLYLDKQDVDKTTVHYELFNTDTKGKNKNTYEAQHKENQDKMSIITIKVDDRTIEFPLAYGGDKILDAALKHGADLPYACKGGVCSTCKAKIVEGTVEMEVNYALEPDELEKGFVLTCQSHPTSERVFVDFDER